MKILIAYYSRTGITKKVALLISKKLKAQCDEIIDKKDRSGALGWIIAGKDATQKRTTEINHKKNPKNYDMIIIGGPVWSWDVTPAVRTYVTNNKKSLKATRVAFFATQGSSGAETKFESMRKILGKKPIATMTINGKDFKDEEYKKKIDEFITTVNF
jgi:flavodoxin